MSPTSTIDVLAKNLRTAGRKRPRPPRVTVAGYGDVMKLKEDLPVSLAGITSLRDFGGCYLVHGRYLLHAARQCNLAFASMVDLNLSPEFVAAAEQALADLPDTRIETVRGNFQETSLYEGLATTDAALLYEVLLHQEHYVEVMREVCARTARYVCIAQPCLREELFPLPSSAVMLQFFDEPLKDFLRTDSLWPKEPRTDQFTTAHWMWGHTMSHLIDVMHGLGWSLANGTIVDNACGPYWEYPLLVFACSNGADGA